LITYATENTLAYKKDDIVLSNDIVYVSLAV